MSGEVIRLPKGAAVPVTLKVLEYELFHFCPLKVSFREVSFSFPQFSGFSIMHWLLNDMSFCFAGNYIQHLICTNRPARHVQLIWCC